MAFGFERKTGLSSESDGRIDTNPIPLSQLSQLLITAVLIEYL
jgi:hypothetical protein